jgi:hypothetical protein
MGEEQRLVAVISPWHKLSELVKKGFRVHSLPREKKVMVWRKDLNGDKDLLSALEKAGIRSAEIRRRQAVTEWEQ